jgi:hypothetical protein
MHGALEPDQHAAERRLPLGGGGCARRVLRVHLERRERRAQLVGCIGREPPLARERLLHPDEQAVQRVEDRRDLGRRARERERGDRPRLPRLDLLREGRQRRKPVPDQQAEEHEQQRDADHERRDRCERELLRQLAPRIVAFGDLDPDLAGPQREHAPLVPAERLRAEPRRERRERRIRRRRGAHEQLAGAVPDLEGDLCLVVVAERIPLVVVRAFERGGERDHDRRGDGRALDLPRHQRLEHAPGGGEPGVEQLPGLFLARVESHPRRGAEHDEQCRDRAGKEHGTDRACSAELLAGREHPVAGLAQSAGAGGAGSAM